MQRGAVNVLDDLKKKKNAIRVLEQNDDDDEQQQQNNGNENRRRRKAQFANEDTLDLAVNEIESGSDKNDSSDEDEDDVFEMESWQIALTLSEMPTKALGLTKQLLNSSQTNSLREQLKQEEKLQAQAGLTVDFKEGVKSFLEKRKAVFTGK